jgi:hypothetical protein
MFRPESNFIRKMSCGNNTSATMQRTSSGQPDHGHNTVQEEKNYWEKLQGEDQNLPKKN